MPQSADPRPSALAAPDRRGKRWRLPRILGVLATLLWAFAIGAGIERVWRYESTPGVSVVGPQTWPKSALVRREASRPTLVMFVHPRCPCSRASLGELREIMAQAGGRLNANVLLLRPQGATDDWERTPTWHAAQSIPGVVVSVDRDGAEAKRFGASTSGHTLLYSPKGDLLFAGGITAARGHVGNNDGRRSVLAHLKDGDDDGHVHPVYGCSLHDRVSRGNGA